MVSLNNYDIINLIIKYNSEDDLNYIRGIIGSDERIRYILNNCKITKNIINDIPNDDKFLKILHNVYYNICNIKELYNTELRASLLYFDNKYIELRKKIDEINIKNNKSIILSDENAIIKMKNNIANMKTIDEMDTKYLYKKEIAYNIVNDVKEFSIEKQFSDEGFKYLKGLNSVSVITPNQTISRFNDNTVNGLKGSGNHDANFEQIIETVYGKSFPSAITGQDIKIRYVNQFKNKYELSYKMTIEMPLIINTTQKMSLCILNEEIKNFESKNNVLISIYAFITDYKNKNYFQTFDNQNNLDNIINNTIIDDNINYENKEILYVGYPNSENHYNNGKQK